MSPKQRKVNQFTDMVYDDLGRMTQRLETDLLSTWVYDKQSGQSCVTNHSCGKLIEAYTLNGSNKENTETHSFDNYGRPSVSTQQRDVMYTHTMNYDAWGRLLGETHQRASDAAKVFERRYNQFGYQFQMLRANAAIVGGYQVLWQANEMNARQQLSKAALGNNLNVERRYLSNSGHLQTAILTNATGGIQLQEAYEYKTLGNVLNRTQSWGADTSGHAAAYFSEGFTYDNLNRLATATVVGLPMQTFTYDDIGNLKSKTGVGTGLYVYPMSGNTSFNLNGASQYRPHAVESIPGIGSFTYDDNGNLIAGAGKTVSWTSFDMPLTMTKGSESSTFTYGADHQRVKQVRSDGVTTYYAAGMEVENKAGVLTIKTYWPGGLGLEIDKQNQATELLWTHTDRIGSPIAITDIGGGLVERLAYDSWGKRRDLNGAEDIANSIDGVKDNKGFTGHEMLDKLDLVHMNGRIYDPFTARFMSADPIIQDPLHSQSYNRYTYVWNNPTNLTDPTGFEAQGNCDQTCQRRQKEEDKTATDCWWTAGCSYFGEGHVTNGDYVNESAPKTTADLSNSVKMEMEKLKNRTKYSLEDGFEGYPAANHLKKFKASKAILNGNVRVARVGNKYTLITDISVYGSSVFIKNRVDAYWGTANQVYKEAGVTYSIAPVNFRPVDNMRDADVVFTWYPSLPENKAFGNAVNGEVGLDRSQFREYEKNNTVPHEVGHAAYGLGDAYISSTVFSKEIGKNVSVTYNAIGRDNYIMATDTGVFAGKDIKTLIMLIWAVQPKQEEKAEKK